VRPSLALLALLTAALAGCLAPASPEAASLDQGASEARFTILPPEEVWVPSSVDGKGLHNALYRPDTDAPVPVWINFSPYWGDTAMAEGDAFGRYMVNEYVPRGYAVVLSAVRGTGHSEGCFQVAGDLEVQDAWDVVEHFSTQPWSNGNVGAGGKSYDSTTQNGLLAKLPHPALKTTFHVSGITDFYRYVAKDGVAYSFGASFNTRYALAFGLDEYGVSPWNPFNPEADPQALDDESPRSLARLADDAACPEFARMTASGYGLDAHGLKDAYWQERAWTRDIPASPTTTSIFFVHGLQDWNVKPDHILPWLSLLPEDVQVKGWLHQWTREPEGGHVYPMRDDWNRTMLAWMDHWLKGVPNGITDGPAFESQGDDGTWRTSATWPPTPEDLLEVPLQGPETVVADAARGTLRVAGAPTLTIEAASATPEAILTAVLYDEAPGGERTWLNQAVLRASLRNGLEGPPAPVPPGQPLAYDLEFYPMDAVLEEGHRWVLVLGALPRFHDLPPTATPIQWGEGTLRLPRAPLEPTVAPEPVAIDCFAC
jgi:X-Pro dipeptidyl-peptidase